MNSEEISRSKNFIETHQSLPKRNETCESPPMLTKDKEAYHTVPKLFKDN